MGKIFFLWKLVFGLCLSKNWSKPWQGKTSECCFLRQKKREKQFKSFMDLRLRSDFSVELPHSS